jgi:3-oxoacyl-[acyl-carrier protein] reductase
MRKSVIVTGASRGLGRAVALKFGREGWNVVVNFLASKESADEAAHEIIESGGDAFTLKADVRSYPDTEAMAAEALDRFGRLDVLVNCAAVTRPSLIPKLNNDELQYVIDTNLKGCFNTIKAVSRTMMKQRSGHIINISSIQGVRGKAGQAAYAASKAGLIGLTKAAAVELAPRGIQVNAVLPGYMLTDMGLNATDKERDAALNDNLLKRYSEVGEVADFIYHLAGMKAVSGQVFNLDSRII